jgi:hypothetical protein
MKTETTLLMLKLIFNILLIDMILSWKLPEARRRTPSIPRRVSQNPQIPQWTRVQRRVHRPRIHNFDTVCPIPIMFMAALGNIPIPQRVRAPYTVKQQSGEIQTHEHYQ